MYTTCTHTRTKGWGRQRQTYKYIIYAPYMYKNQGRHSDEWHLLNRLRCKVGLLLMVSGPHKGGALLDMAHAGDHPSC